MNATQVKFTTTRADRHEKVDRQHTAAAREIERIRRLRFVQGVERKLRAEREVFDPSLPVFLRRQAQ